MTVLRPVENVLFLEEWLGHHCSMGINYFYLYISRNRNQHNYYGVKYEDVVKISYADALIQIAKIIQGSRCIIEVIDNPLLNTDGDGQQQDAYRHFLTIIDPKVKWSIFMDVDEFIYTAWDLKDYFNDMESSHPNNLASVEIIMKKFESRWFYDPRQMPVRSIYNSFNATWNDYSLVYWPKVWIRTGSVTDIVNVHIYKFLDGCTSAKGGDLLRYYHYNANFSTTSKDYEFAGPNFKERAHVQYSMNEEDRSMAWLVPLLAE